MCNRHIQGLSTTDDSTNDTFICNALLKITNFECSIFFQQILGLTVFNESILIAFSFGSFSIAVEVKIPGYFISNLVPDTLEEFPRCGLSASLNTISTFFFHSHPSEGTYFCDLR